MSDRLVARLGARFYYGWVVLAVASLGGFISAGSSQMYIGSVLLAITQDTGWTNTAISGALLAGTLVGGLISPLAGAWVDRHGPRALMSVAAVAMAGGFALMGWSPSLAVFYLGYMLARGAAQGALGGAAQRAIAVHWFLHYRGRALGIASMSVPLGGAAMAFAGAYAQRHGWDWREIFVAMAGTERTGGCPAGAAAAAQESGGAGPGAGRWAGGGARRHRLAPRSGQAATNTRGPCHRRCAPGRCAC